MTPLADPLIAPRFTVQKSGATSPLLPADSVKDFIIRGATQPRVSPTTGVSAPPANIGVNGIYQLDAYGAHSLLSKERPGTPICGYDVRFENGAVVLARPGGTRAPYPVATPCNDGSVSVAQGGRRIAVGSSIYIVDSSPPQGVTVIDHLGAVIHTLPNVHRRLYLERDTADIRYVPPQDTAWLTGRPLLDLWGPGRTAQDRNLNILGPFVSGDVFGASWIEVSPAGDYAAALMLDRTYVTCTPPGGGSYGGIVQHSDMRLIPLDGSTPTTVRTDTYDQCARDGYPRPNDDYLGNDQVAFSHDGRRAVFGVAFLDSDPLAQGNDVIRTRLYNLDLTSGTAATTTVVQGWYVNGPRFEADDNVFLAYDFDGLLPSAPGGGPCRAMARQATSLGSTVGSPQSVPVSECFLVQGYVTRSNLRALRTGIPGQKPQPTPRATSRK